ncbi:MAG: N-formylglutamate amidohydrolase [Candidatus Uhrbacteria bacterium]|nr:N-formylglutamate amidohydrolase [Candidatus Uhrbacteria bacterium]
MSLEYSVSISDYVQVLESRKPSKVLITVPHDGLYGFELEPFLSPRKNGATLHDRGVWPIVRDMLGVCGANVIRGLMSRHYLDYNRNETDAFESPQFQSSYQAYHGRIFHELRQMQNRFGSEELLFLDLHGFGTQPSRAPRDGFDLVFGTGNRSTIPHGEPDQELARFLETRGYTVFLPTEQVQRQPFDPLNGGFTVRAYARELGVNAIQIEIAPRFRHRNSAMLGTRLSNDLATFLAERYAI